jgi:hypothetical protein
MVKIKCSLGYKKLKIGDVSNFAGGVRDGVYGHALVFTLPPLSEVEFQALISTFTNTRDIYVQGGKGQKGTYVAAKTALFEGIDATASYVDTIADGDENIITLAGFDATKGTKSDAPKPVQASGVKVKAGDTGVLHAECDKQDVAVAYGCIMTAGEPIPFDINIDNAGQMQIGGDEPMPPMPPTAAAGVMAAIASGGIIDFNMGRKKTFTNLARGVTYYFYFFAVNARGVGGISLPAQGWCL